MRLPNDVSLSAGDRAEIVQQLFGVLEALSGRAARASGRPATSSIPLAFKVKTTSARSSRFTSGSSWARALEMLRSRSISRRQRPGRCDRRGPRVVRLRRG